MTSFLDQKLALAATAAAFGVLATVVGQRLLGKRGLLTYNVWHSRVGLSADDAVFGSVQVTWNGQPVANLYSSTIELRNESLTDYSDVVARVFTNDAFLLTERTEIVDTTRSLAWTPSFAQALTVLEGTKATQLQRDLYDGQRDYSIPTLNRGQVVRFTFLNVAKANHGPSIWLEVVHKGVILKFRVAAQQFMGVPQPVAVLVGSALGIAVLVITVAFVRSVLFASLISMVYGLVVLIPGALTVRLWRRLRDAVAG